MNDLTITTTVQDGVAIVTAAGDLDVYTAAHLRPAVRPAAKAGPLVIDLEGCEFLDATGLGVLVGALKDSRAAGHELAYVCTREPVLRVFRVSGLIRVMRICDTVDEAVKAVLAGKGEDDG